MDLGSDFRFKDCIINRDPHRFTFEIGYKHSSGLINAFISLDGMWLLLRPFHFRGKPIFYIDSTKTGQQQAK